MQTRKESAGPALHTRIAKSQRNQIRETKSRPIPKAGDTPMCLVAEESTTVTIPTIPTTNVGLARHPALQRDEARLGRCERKSATRIACGRRTWQLARRSRALNGQLL